jgi:hypothetical protein
MEPVSAIHLAGAGDAAAGRGGEGDGEPGASHRRAIELRGGGGVRRSRRRKRWWWGLEGRPGAAEDRRRKSFEEGGAARRSRERRRPRAAVAGGLAGGGCGGGEGLEFGDGASLLPRLRRAALLPCSFLASRSSSPPFRQLQ